jgi:hypothetical protein
LLHEDVRRHKPINAARGMLGSTQIGPVMRLNLPLTSIADGRGENNDEVPL